MAASPSLPEVGVDQARACENSISPPVISLCMIVRNEEEMLPRFLAAARGLWDELVVVDTGSTDGTREILREAKAVIIERPWDDDFAGARNAALERATGEWILVLDADEMVTDRLSAQIRELTRDPAVGAATLRFIDQFPHGHCHQARLLRFYRRHPSVRFRGIIHEDASEAVLAMLEATARKLVHLDGTVEHLGYVRQRAAARNKKERDLRLLKAQLARDPDDLFCWYKMLQLARFWNDRVLWRELAPEAARALDQGRDLGAARFGGELVALIAKGLFDPGTPLYLDFLQRHARRILPSAAYYLARGEAEELVGDWAEASADFQRCRELAHLTSDEQYATVRPLLGLARVALAKCDLAEAMSKAEEALSYNARDLEALVGAAVLARAKDGEAGLGQFEEKHVQTYGDSSELHQALGEIAFLSKDFAAAVKQLRLAAGEPPQGRTALRLAHAFLALGSLDEARVAAQALVPQIPEAALGILVCDLVEGKSSELEIDLEQEEADSAFKSWIDVIALNPGLKAKFDVNVYAVADYFPWAVDYAAAAVP